MRFFPILLLLLLVSLSASAAPNSSPSVGDVATLQSQETGIVRFTLFTTEGHVSFSVPANWGVMAIQSKPPVAVAGFQIPNPDDVGSPDATNASISLIQPETEKGSKVLELVGKSYEGDVAKSSHLGWDYFMHDAHQGDTMYTIMDAKRRIADFVVAVRMAWPHLANAAPEYTKTMKATFDKLLKSVDGDTGSYVVKQGEVIRRPTQ